MGLRRVDGFKRYAVGVQYHGASFLGFSYQKDKEDRVLPDGTDLRGYRTVEGRIRDGLKQLFSNWENIQVSSRTDRGVHALKNTFHVDVLGEDRKEVVQKLWRGLNYYLTRQTTSWRKEHQPSSRKRKRASQAPPFAMLGENWSRNGISDEIRILSAAPAPEFMMNHYAEKDPTQAPFVDWNARFSATKRTYIYRILSFTGLDEGGVPFEWDRSWRVRAELPLNVAAMQQAAVYLQGTHDFSSFRGKNCQRHTPTVTMKSIQIHNLPYGSPLGWGGGSGLLGLGNGDPTKSPELITIQIVGDSFMYRQVRNMVGCLVEVGRGKLQPTEVQDLLHAKSRSAAPGMAPAHGLFLVDVQHGDFHI
jgi:tRNA pseudouridine(38-40) synthase